MKVKTFQFRVSNFQGNRTAPGIWNSDLHGTDLGEYMKDAYKNIKSEAEIDKEVNDWLKKSKADVIDLKVTAYTVDRHNNGRDDTVVVIYTVLYK